jgi:hypothetical protein
MSGYDDRPVTRGDLNFLEQRIGYRLWMLGFVVVYCTVMLFLLLKGERHERPNESRRAVHTGPAVYAGGTFPASAFIKGFSYPGDQR